MPTATRELHYVDTKLPKLRTTYHIPVAMSSPSGVSASKQDSMSPAQSRELPMPVISRFTSIDQAHATLQHCATRLNNSWQGNPARSSPPSPPIDGNEKLFFQQWLARWESAFTAYLSVHMSSMSANDVTQSRTLKANHLSCTILASDAGPSKREYGIFTAEFQAIVELANAVISLRPPRSRSPAPVTSALDMCEPLYVVIACCDRMSTRNKAIELLGKINSR